MGIFTRANRIVVAAAIPVVLGLTACGDGAESSGGLDLEASIELQAVIEGFIRDGVTGEPLEGIKIEVSDLGIESEATAPDAGGLGSLTSRTVTTDALGYYQVTVFTSGSHTIVRSGTAENGKTYARTRSSIFVDPNATLPDSADGQYIIGVNSDASMYPTNGTLRATVYGSNQRDVIAGAPVLISYNSGAISDPGLPRNAMTDDAGDFELTGMPTGVTINIQIRPLDRDDDGVLDTDNFSRNFVLYEEGVNERFVGPVGSFNNPQLLWHNVDSMRTFPTDPEFIYVFSHAMDTSTSSTVVTLVDTDENSTVPTVQEWDEGGFQLTVRPQGMLEAGHNHRISISAWSLEPSNIGSGNLSFRTAGGADEDPVPAAPVLLEDPSNITFYQNSFRLGLQPLPVVDQYRIYARTAEDQEWILVHNHNPTGSLPLEDFNVSISGSEISNLGRGTGSLFSHGGSLYFAASAVVGGIPGPVSPVLEVMRTQCLNVNVYAGTNNTPNSYANNTDGLRTKPLVIQLRASGNTWLDQDVDATFSLDDSPLAMMAPRATAFEKVRVNPWTVEWRYEIPVDDDVQFLGYEVDVSGALDVNGNGICDPDVTFQRLVPTSGASDADRFNFEMDAQGWTGDGDWARGTATNYGPTTGGYDCADLVGDDCYSAMYFGTNLSGFRTDDTESVLRSPSFRTPTSGSTVYFRRYFDLYPGDTLAVVFVDEENDDQESFLFNYTSGYNFSGWTQQALGLVNNTVGHLEFRYSAGSSAAMMPVLAHAGAFIDDTTITGTTSRDLTCNDVTSCPN